VANRFFVTGLGGNNNWGQTGAGSNWSLTSGGAGGQTVPTASDDVFFDGNSPNCTVDTSARVAKSLIFTGYTNTITMSQQITVSGSITLVSAMTIAGAGALLANAAATLTSNGKTWPNDLSLTGSVTYTFADNWTVTGLTTLGSGAQTMTMTSNQITCNGGLTTGVTSGSLSGTCLIVVGGGTVTGNTGRINNSLTFNSAGTITFASGSSLTFGTGTYTYTAGTFSFAGGHTLFLPAAGTMNLDGVTWKDVTITNAGGTVTVTFSSKLVNSGLLTIGTGAGITTLTGQSIETAGGLRQAQSTGTIGGTTVIKITGAGTLDAPSLTTGYMGNMIELAAGSAAVVITSTFRCDFGNVLNSGSTNITSTAGAWDSAGISSSYYVSAL